MPQCDNAQFGRRQRPTPASKQRARNQTPRAHESRHPAPGGRLPLRSGRVTLQDKTDRGRWNVNRERDNATVRQCAIRPTRKQRTKADTLRREADGTAAYPTRIAHGPREEASNASNGYLLAGLAPRRSSPLWHFRIVALSHSLFPHHFATACPCRQQQIASIWSKADRKQTPCRPKHESRHPVPGGRLPLRSGRVTLQDKTDRGRWNVNRERDNATVRQCAIRPTTETDASK